MESESIKLVAIRNARATVINAFLTANSFTLPIWQLFYTIQLGLTLTQSMVLFMSTWATSGIANVLTGTWADKYGRLKLFRIGALIQIVSIIPFFFVTNFFVLLAFSVFYGFGASMFDGSLGVNVMDSYDKAGVGKKEYGKFISDKTVATYLGRVASGVVGAWMYTVSAFMPLLMNMVVQMIALIESGLITEMRHGEPSTAKNIEFIPEVLKYVWESRVLVNYFIIMLVVCVSTESFWSAFQSYLKLRDLPVQYFGVLFGVIAIFSAVSAYVYRKVHSRFTWGQLSVITMVLMVLALLLSRISFGWMPFVVAVIMGLGFGTVTPIGQTVVKDNAKSKYRSTVSSIRQLVNMIGFVTTSVLVGVYVDNFGSARMLDIITVQAVICLVAVLMIALYSGRVNSKPQS